jgi:hypothetical protein
VVVTSKSTKLIPKILTCSDGSFTSRFPRHSASFPLSTMSYANSTVLPPPLGYTIDLEHPQRRDVQKIFTVTLISSAMVILLIFIRSYASWRLRKERIHVREKWFFVLIVIFAWATHGVFWYLWDQKRIGVHAWELSLDKYNQLNRVRLAQDYVLSLRADECYSCSWASFPASSSARQLPN